MKKIDIICKETINQAIENIIFRIEKNKNKKIKVLDNLDFNIIELNIKIAKEEFSKLDKKGQYIITNEEQYERWINDKRRINSRILHRGNNTNNIKISRKGKSDSI